MFNKLYYLTFILLVTPGLQDCAETPNEKRVNQDSADLKQMLIRLDKSYEKCAFEKQSIIPKNENDRGDGWQVFEMKVRIVCNDQAILETVRILYEYNIDFKNHAGPYWELATWGYDWRP